MSTGTERRPDPFDVEVGVRVRALRKAREISQSDLAAAAGITFQQVQKYERGTNRISASKLQQIARRLGVPISELLGEADSQSAATVNWTLMTEPDVMEIAQAFHGIRSPGLRKKLRGLILSLSEQGRTGPSDPGHA